MPEIENGKLKIEKRRGLPRRAFSIFNFQFSICLRRRRSVPSTESPEIENGKLKMEKRARPVAPRFFNFQFSIFNLPPKEAGALYAIGLLGVARPVAPRFFNFQFSIFNLPPKEAANA